MTDAKDQSTFFKYDNSGRMIEEIDAEGQVTKYTYNKTNQLVSTTQPDESIVRYRYDRAGRLTFRKGNTEEPTQFQYQNGDLVFAQNEDAVIERSYDPLGRVLQETTRIAQGPTHQINYAYTQDRLAQSAFAGKSVGYLYNEAGYLKTIQSEGDLVEFAYDPLGRRAQLTINGKLIKKYGYDENSRLKELDYKFEDKPIFNQRLTYNAVSNITQSKLDDDLYEYEYDEIDQLTVAKGPKESERFYYDTAGNHLFDPSKKAKYSKTNALLSIPDQTFYQYDPQGRPLTITSPEKEMDLAWNSKSQLKSAVIARPEGPKQSSKVRYLYDPFGRRIGKVFDDGRREYYGYDREDIVAVYDGIGTIQHTYLHGPDLDEILIAQQGTNRNYPATDQLGSIRQTIDKDGLIIAEYSYENYGERKIISTVGGGIIPTAYGFTGREYDEETGLYYNRNRYYTGKDKRFLTRDPIKQGGGRNLYAYVKNNPTNFTDPLGLAAQNAACGDLYEKCAIAGTIGHYDAHKVKDTPSMAHSETDRLVVLGKYTRRSKFGGEADAFRHCYWLCIMARRIGKGQAIKVGVIHEECKPVEEPGDKEMDIHNNQIGASYAKETKTDGGCSTRCQGGVKSGDLIVNKPGGY